MFWFWSCKLIISRMCCSSTWWLLVPNFCSQASMGVTSHIPCDSIRKSVSHMVCLIWKFSRGGWRTAFLPGSPKWCTNCHRLCLSIKMHFFKKFWILIFQYNNSLRAPWKRCVKNWTKIDKVGPWLTDAHLINMDTHTLWTVLSTPDSLV